MVALGCDDDDGYIDGRTQLGHKQRVVVLDEISGMFLGVALFVFSLVHPVSDLTCLCFSLVSIVCLPKLNRGHAPESKQVDHTLYIFFAFLLLFPSPRVQSVIP